MKNGKKKGLKTLAFAAGLSALAAVALVGAVFAIVVAYRLPSPERFGERQVSQSTKLYDRTGKILIYEMHGDQKRTVIPFESVPQSVKNAILATENADFYNEPAFSWKGILRSLLVNLQSGTVRQGGSTITQQLVKNTLLNADRTVSRKVKELILAVRLESKYSKDEIFGFYLNQIPWGSNAYGVEAASQIYLGKRAADLTVREASVLAAMLKAPSYYSPWGSHRKELLERSDFVLGRMVAEKLLSQEDADKAKKETPVFVKQSIGSILAPHFALAVRDKLVETYGEQMATAGGLKVVTTLDADLQKIAEKAVENGAARNTKLYDGRNAALVAADPKTGQILAMVGSKNYFGAAEPEGCKPGACKFEGNYNVATQGLRQPGSALKPFVYLSAFEKGYGPKTILWDVPTEFDTRNADDPEKSFSPNNFDDKFNGPMPMDAALAGSRNVTAVKALYLAGMDDTLANLAKAGITTLTDKERFGLSLTLGGGEVKMVDMIKAYATLAAGGVVREQRMILSVEDPKGEKLEDWTEPEEGEQALGGQAALQITQALASKELREGLLQSSLGLTVFDGYEVALKTGTTQDYRDAWAFGYAPNLVVGVWAGNNDNTPLQGHGGSVLAAVPMWSEFLKDALKKFEPETFPKPEEKPLPAKPMLDGTAGPQAHAILFYVDKADPLGAVPSDPAKDPQFFNWEKGVNQWTGTNYYANYAGGTAQSAQTSKGKSVKVEIVSPEKNATVAKRFFVKARLTAANDELSRAELYLDNRQIGGLAVDGQSYWYDVPVDVSGGSQHMVEVRATTYGGLSSSATVTVTAQ